MGQVQFRHVSAAGSRGCGDGVDELPGKFRFSTGAVVVAAPAIAWRSRVILAGPWGRCDVGRAGVIYARSAGRGRRGEGVGFVAFSTLLGRCPVCIGRHPDALTHAGGPDDGRALPRFVDDLPPGSGPQLSGVGGWQLPRDVLPLQRRP